MAMTDHRTLHRTFLAVALACSLLAIAAPAAAQVHQAPPPALKWSFSGPFGKYDQAQLQRGFKIYREVCASCHSMSMLAFRNLADAGGPGYSEAQAAAVAAEYKIKDIDDKGEAIERAGRLADYFPSPFANDLAAAAANGGVAPPDFSTLAKARTYERGFPWFVIDMVTQYQEQGPDYIVSVLKGYKETPKDMTMPAGGNYNEMM
jgi:ubiquinol-cytochrome c reductase cytochrome b/c1 subunit